MDIVATYCTNYNGFYLQGEGIDDEDDKADEVRTNVVDELVDECDDDGEYYGSKRRQSRSSSAKSKPCTEMMST